MVFFTCNHCGESVKKPSVEKHYQQKCRNNVKSVSCMDCQKDFNGDEYVAHTKCITEAQKYSGKNFVPKENKNSGQKKQETWMDIVRSILESTEYQLSAQTRNIFQRLQNYDNVPRKKAKFQNFVANCLKIHQQQAEPVWNVLEKELENMKKVKQEQLAANKEAIQAAKAKQNKAGEENGRKRKQEDNNSDGEKVEEKKKKPSSIEESNQQADGEANESFQWSSVLEKIVAKHNEGLTLDKLKKKLLKKYKSKLGLEELSDKEIKQFEKKFSKTLKKCPSVQVDGEKVVPS